MPKNPANLDGSKGHLLRFVVHVFNTEWFILVTFYQNFNASTLILSYVSLVRLPLNFHICLTGSSKWILGCFRGYRQSTLRCTFNFVTSFRRRSLICNWEWRGIGWFLVLYLILWVSTLRTFYIIFWLYFQCSRNGCRGIRSILTLKTHFFQLLKPICLLYDF